MENKIFGMNSESFYVLIFILLLVILGIVSFHYYVYLSGGGNSALRAGTGFAVTLLPANEIKDSTHEWNHHEDNHHECPNKWKHNKWPHHHNYQDY